VHATLNYVYFVLSGVASLIANAEGGDGIEVATVGSSVARERLSMRKIDEVLRMRFELKRSHPHFARSIETVSSTVAD